jgi:hypothetical protein
VSQPPQFICTPQLPLRLVIVGGSHHRFPLVYAVSLVLLFLWLGVSSLVLVVIVVGMTPIIYLICRSVHHFTSTSGFIKCWSY